MEKKRLVLGLAALVLASCASHPAEPASVATAGCADLGATTEIAATHLGPGQVYGAREVRERVFLARALQPERTVGADLYVLATPHTTAEYLQRTLSCHAAEGQSLSADDPFHPAGGHVTSVEVRSVNSGFAVRVRGSDRETAREIWQRAQRFADPGSVTVEQIASTASDDTTL